MQPARLSQIGDSAGMKPLLMPAFWHNTNSVSSLLLLRVCVSLSFAARLNMSNDGSNGGRLKRLVSK
jgi:hypothetical protein